MKSISRSLLFLSLASGATAQTWIARPEVIGATGPQNDRVSGVAFQDTNGDGRRQDGEPWRPFSGSRA